MRKKKSLIGLVFTVLALLLLCVSFLLPWYSVHIDSKTSTVGGTVETHHDFYAYFDHWKIVSESGDNTEEDIEDYDSGSELEKVFHNTMILTLIAMLMTGLGVVGLFLLKGGKMGHKLVSLIIAIAFIFSLVAPLYLMMSLPDAMEENNVNYLQTGDEINEKFFGEDEIGGSFFGVEGEVKINWGGDLSWYMVIAAAGLNAVGAMSALMAGRSETSGVSEGTQRQHPGGYEQPREQQPPPPKKEEEFDQNVDEEQGMITP